MQERFRDLVLGAIWSTEGAEDVVVVVIDGDRTGNAGESCTTPGDAQGHDRVVVHVVRVPVADVRRESARLGAVVARPDSPGVIDLQGIAECQRARTRGWVNRLALSGGVDGEEDVRG